MFTIKSKPNLNRNRSNSMPMYITGRKSIHKDSNVFFRQLLRSATIFRDAIFISEHEINATEAELIYKKTRNLLLEDIQAVYFSQDFILKKQKLDLKDKLNKAQLLREINSIHPSKPPSMQEALEVIIKKKLLKTKNYIEQAQTIQKNLATLRFPFSTVKEKTLLMNTINTLTKDCAILRAKLANTTLKDTSHLERKILSTEMSLKLEEAHLKRLEKNLRETCENLRKKEQSLLEELKTLRYESGLLFKPGVAISTYHDKEKNLFLIKLEKTMEELFGIKPIRSDKVLRTLDDIINTLKRKRKSMQRILTEISNNHNKNPEYFKGSKNFVNYNNDTTIQTLKNFKKFKPEELPPYIFRLTGCMVPQTTIEKIFINFQYNMVPKVYRNDVYNVKVKQEVSRPRSNTYSDLAFTPR